ncbi:unnamed protein product [Rhizophagus irregularis]|nr:unnamed protein product [Rhizophagus irregularis]
MQNNEKTYEWINWIEEAINKKHIKHYEYECFSNIQETGSGAFGKVFRANYKNFEQYLALKSFYNINDVTLKEIVHELKLQREVDFHNNIIRFYGITKFESSIENVFNPTKGYLLVMEYADGACSISCLHDEGIVHRDLHSSNVLVHQNSIKLADFGLSKRIEDASNSQTALHGRREEIISHTPNDYSNLYTDCWNGEPIKRPSIRDVVDRLKIFISCPQSEIQ